MALVKLRSNARADIRPIAMQSVCNARQRLLAGSMARMLNVRCGSIAGEYQWLVSGTEQHAVASQAADRGERHFA